MERPSDLRDQVSRDARVREMIRARKIKEADHDEDQHAYHRACRGACGVRAGNAELRATQRRNEQQPRASAEELQHPGREVQTIRLGRLRDRRLPRLHGATWPAGITGRFYRSGAVSSPLELLSFSANVNHHSSEFGLLPPPLWGRVGRGVMR